MASPLDLQINVGGLNQLVALTKSMEQLEKQVAVLDKKLPDATKEMAGFGKAAGRGVRPVKSLAGSIKGLVGEFAAFAGLAVGVGATFQNLEKSDKASAAVATLGVDSKKLASDLTDLRKELNNNVSALELQQNAFEVAQAGFTDTAEITEILGNATKSAQAKLIDSTTTVRALTSVLRSYNLTASDSKALSDKFFATIASGNLTLDQYASVIGRVAPIASAAGVGIEEVNAALAVITQQGSSAGEAATQVSAAISSILGPSEQAKKLAKDLGLEFNEEALAAKGFAGVLEDVVEKTGGSSEKLIKLFGSLEAVQGVLALSTQNFGQYKKALEAQTDSVGKVDKAYETVSKTITASLARVQNSFGALTQAIVVDSAPAIIAAFDGIAEIINALNSPIGKAALQIGLMAAAIIALNKAIAFLKATQLAAWFKPIVAQILLGNKAFATFILRTKAAAIATKALQGVMATVPWVAAAAGALFVATETYKAVAANMAFEKVLKSVDEQIIKAKINELTKELVKVEKEAKESTASMSQFGGSMAFASLKAAELKTQIRQLKDQLGAGLPQNYTVAGITYDWKTGKPINPPTVEPKIELPKVDLGDLGGGGGAAIPLTDDLEALERSRKLLEDTVPIQEQLNFAELEGNEILAETLRSKLAILDAEKAGVDAIESLNTAEGKAIQAQINKLEMSKLIQQNAANELNVVSAVAKAQEDALRPLQEQRRILDATLNGRGEEERLLIDIENATKGLTVEQKILVEGLIRGNAEREKELQQLQEIKAFYAQISQTIQDGIVNGIMAAVDGSKELSEVLSGVLRSLAQMFLKKGVGMAFSGLGFADGGRPPMNQASVVGERGPELFVPDSAGTVLPNEAFAAARAALGGSGTNASDDAFNENVSSINNTNTYLQQQAIATENQGIMRDSSGMVIQTQVINNVEYATIDQVAAASAASAKQARAQVFSDMKNRPAIRRQVGVK